MKRYGRIISISLLSLLVIGGLSQTFALSTESTNSSLQQAKKVAIEKVGGVIQEADVDDDHYDVEVIKDGQEYDLEIDKKGTVIELEKDSSKNDDKKISLEEAKTLALKQVNGKIIHIDSDDDDFEIEIEKDNILYEIEINRYTGKIDHIEQENIPSQKSKITKEQAKEIALKQVDGQITSIDFDDDDYEYSIEIQKENIEYEISIDATNGKVLEVEKDD